MQQKCYLQPFSKNSRFFLKNSPFFPNSSNCLNFLKNLTNRVAFSSKFATISDFWKTQIFLGPPIFFAKNSNSECFEKSHHFIRIRHQIGYLQFVSKNPSFFLKKTIYFSEKHKVWKFWEILLFQLHYTAKLIPNFERFEKSNYFIRFLKQKCYRRHV